MFRRIISTFVLLGFLGGQSAAIPHAHGGSEPSGHDSTPHIHIGHCHHHCHSHCGHKHSHRSEKPAGNSFKSSNDHDTDAIYLPHGTSSVIRSAEGSQSLQLLTALLPASVVVDHVATDAAQVGFRQHLGETCAPNCALYLELRALRI